MIDRVIVVCIWKKSMSPLVRGMYYFTTDRAILVRIYSTVTNNLLYVYIPHIQYPCKSTIYAIEINIYPILVPSVYQ